jgi:2-dehydropantoate 2-reductase
LVVIGLKTTANHTFPGVLPPLSGPKTLVLTLQNGLGNEDAVARVVGPERTVGGLCFVCLNRVAPGRIVHSAHGVVVIGEHAGPSRPRTRCIAELFNQAGIECRVAEDIAKAHWEKLVWNIPFNGLGVAGAAGLEAVESGQASGPPGACLTTKDLLGDPRWEKIVRELMMETIGAARALGFDIPDSTADFQINRTRAMGAYKASTLIDFERGQALELESLFIEPLRQAHRAGAKCPRLEKLCQLLPQLRQPA